MATRQTRVVATIGALAALTFAVPAFGGQAERRATNAKQKGQTSEPERRVAPREESRPSPPARPQDQATSRQANPPQNAGGTGSANARPTQGYAVPRPRPDAHPPQKDSRDDRPIVIAPRVIVGPQYRPDHRPDYRSHYRPYRVTRFHQPYFTFRPRVQLAFGISIGHPVAYPVWYDPYAVYGRSLGPRYGGISFDMDPYDAAVFIDGNYVGIVDDFSPYEAPLTMRAGVHRVEVRARGFQPMIFDITVVPGQVIPYRGSLAYGR